MEREVRALNCGIGERRKGGEEGVVGEGEYVFSRGLGGEDGEE